MWKNGYLSNREILHQIFSCAKHLCDCFLKAAVTLGICASLQKILYDRPVRTPYIFLIREEHSIKFYRNQKFKNFIFDIQEY